MENSAIKFHKYAKIVSKIKLLKIVSKKCHNKNKTKKYRIPHQINAPKYENCINLSNKSSKKLNFSSMKN